MGEVNVQLRTRHGLFLNQKWVGTENEKENKIETVLISLLAQWNV